MTTLAPDPGTTEAEAPEVLTGEVVPTDGRPQGLELGLKGRRLRKHEAELLTERIRGLGHQLWVLVAIAHERKAYLAMGYKDWKSYVAAELGYSYSWSFQQVQTGRVMYALAEAAHVEDPTVLPTVPARAVARLQDPNVLTAVKREVARQVEGAEPVSPAEAIAAALKALPKQVRSSPAVAESEATEEATGAGGGIRCPLCGGGGDLGTGAAAQELHDAAERLVQEYVTTPGN